jgi:hypothetical protein
LRYIGFLLIFLRSRIPDFLSIPLANTLLVAVPVMLAWGLDAYAGERLRIRLGLAWLAVSLVLLVVVTYGQSRFNVRVFTVAILHLAIYTVIAIRLLRLHDGGVRLQQIVIAVLFLVSAAAMGARGFVSIAGPAQEGLFVSSPSSVIGFLESFIMPICVAIGLLSMVVRKTQVEREKRISDLEVALGRVKTLSGLLPICASCKKIRDVRETGAKWSTTSAIILRWISATVSVPIALPGSILTFPEAHRNSRIGCRDYSPFFASQSIPLPAAY